MTRAHLLTLFFPLVLTACSARKDASSVPQADTARTNDSTAASLAGIPVRPAFSYEERQGSVLYTKYCSVCHGREGKGDGFNAFNLDPRPRDFSDAAYMAALSDDQIIQTIGGGGRSVNKSPLMPSYGWTIDSRQILYIASYIRTFTLNP